MPPWFQDKRCAESADDGCGNNPIRDPGVENFNMSRKHIPKVSPINRDQEDLDLFDRHLNLGIGSLISAEPFPSIGKTRLQAQSALASCIPHRTAPDSLRVL